MAEVYHGRYFISYQRSHQSSRSGGNAECTRVGIVVQRRFEFIRSQARQIDLGLRKAGGRNHVIQEQPKVEAGLGRVKRGSLMSRRQGRECRRHEAPGVRDDVARRVPDLNGVGVAARREWRRRTIGEVSGIQHFWTGNKEDQLAIDPQLGRGGSDNGCAQVISPE